MAKQESQNQTKTKKEKEPSSLSRLTAYAGGYKYLTYASQLLSAISALFALVPFYYLWKIIKEVLEVMPDFENAQNIVKNGRLAVLFAVLSLVIYICSLLCSHLSAFRIQSNLKKELMQKIVSLPVGSIEAVGSGKLRKTVEESTAATETYLAHQLPDMAGSIVTPIGLLAFLFVFDWRFGLFSLIPIMLSFIVMTAFMTGKKLQIKMNEYQNALDDMSNEAVEYVRGIPVVKTFGQTVFSFKKFKSSIDSYSEWAISYTKDMRLPMMALTMLINGVFAFIIFAGIIFSKGTVTDDLILNVLFYTIITPVLTVTMTKIMFQSENKMLVADALKRIDAILELKPLPDAVENKLPKDGTIELKNVSFSYDGEKNAVEGISLKVSPGQTVALVGASGGGKTTIASLIARFFDAQSGEVLIGGVNIKEIEKKELNKLVSFVCQNSKLIKGTIFDNVRLAKPNASKEEVMSALEKAQCLEIIDKFPLGIDTIIGTNGVYLSGGEVQRIAIARAILKDSPIVLLDEATAYADPDNEVKVWQALTELSAGKTVVMIAHRLSTVKNADCICVIDGGRIIEQGTGSELAEKNGAFAKMFKDYLTSVKWRVAREEVK